ncbi:MAG TPA: DUF3667 domain-containing protein [Catalimonadaceae bacterium]|nr:DUF3667 domain-containing protein [Catalimonadaceae bacterium]
MSETEPSQPHCLNCGTILDDRFCSHCGQDSKEFKRSVWNVFFQFFETFTDFDNKLWSSLGPLFFRPGMLTRKFLDGKRKSFLNPIQMYAFFSFIFFLTAFYLPEKEGASAQEEIRKGIRNGMFADSVSENSDSIQDVTVKVGGAKISRSREQNNPGFHINGLENSYSQYDSAQRAKPDEERDRWFVRTIKTKMISINRRFKEKDESIIGELFDGFKSNLPNIIILLLPVFALVLKLLYVRRNYYYVEHLIFGIHLHCFAFALFSFVFLADWALPELEDDLNLIYLWFFIYAFVAMKRIYNQSWIRTFMKFNFLGATYTIFLIIGLVLNLILSFFLVD